MAMMNRRLVKEIEMLSNDPSPGIAVWQVNDKVNELCASITGPENSPYADGVFHLSINIPERYPFEPPNVRFITPIYHPNIDNEGRICLDTLKMQPQGSWSPSVNLNTLLLTIRLLMGSPNADDGLVPDITEQYRRDIASFKRDALQHTKTHAVQSSLPLEYKPSTVIDTTSMKAPIPSSNNATSVSRLPNTNSTESSDDDDDDDGSTGESDEERREVTNRKHNIQEIRGNSNEPSTKRIREDGNK